MNIQSLSETSDKFDMISAWTPKGPAVVNRTIIGLTGQLTNILGISGRGSLQLTDVEFDQLLACMNEVARVRDGGTPTTTEDTAE
jgi:hypothetical protein